MFLPSFPVSDVPNTSLYLGLEKMIKTWQELDIFHLLFEPSNAKNIDFMKGICLSLDSRMDWETRKILADWSRASGQTYRLAKICPVQCHPLRKMD